MSFKWKDRYSLGIPAIDEQHQKLFEIGNRAYELAMLNDGYDHYDEIMEIIEELLDYTKYHFQYEEDLMEKYAYTGLKHQHEEHSFYVDKVSSIDEENIDDNQEQAIMDILDFLSEWISSHILISDRKYVEALRAEVNI